MPSTKITKADPLAEIKALDSIECGEDAAKHFLFDEGYRNLNQDTDSLNGSYGAYPIEVRNVYRHFEDRTEARPDVFVRYEYRTRLLDDARAVIANYVNAPVSETVLVPNVSTAFDTVLRNLIFEPNDVVVYFPLTYFLGTLQYLSETTAVEIEKIDYEYPKSDKWICSAFEQRIQDLKAKGKRVRVAIFDTVTSTPAVRMPFERLVEICRLNDVLSCLDAAHGVGMFPIDVQKLDADFLMSNCHKWLHVPRPCAVMHVPTRNQHLLRTTLPTSCIGFVPKDGQGPSGDKSAFEVNFAYSGTLNDNPYLCIEAAVLWRSKLTCNNLQGEAAIMGYINDLAHRGGQLVAQILGTEVLENEERTIGNQANTNVRLPVGELGPAGEQGSVDLLTRPDEESQHVSAKIMKTMMLKYHAAVFVTHYADKWWVRLGAQVYLTLDDFEYAGKALRTVIASSEWLSA